MPCAAKMTLGEWSGEDTAAIDVATLGLSPFLGALGEYSGTIRAEIGRSQKGLFKMSLNVCVGSLLQVLYILQEECALFRCIEVLYYKGLDVLVSHLLCSLSSTGCLSMRI